MTMEYFGDKLKSLRKAKKLTQAELAKQLDISKWAITSYEQGKTYPSIEVLIKVCAVLDTSADYLLGISDKLPVKMSTLGFTDEEVRLLLQFLNLFQQNRTPEDK